MCAHNLRSRRYFRCGCFLILLCNTPPLFPSLYISTHSLSSFLLSLSFSLLPALASVRSPSLSLSITRSFLIPLIVLVFSSSTPVRSLLVVYFSTRSCPPVTQTPPSAVFKKRALHAKKRARPYYQEENTEEPQLPIIFSEERHRFHS